MIGRCMTHNAPTQPWSLARRRIARREGLFRRFVDEGVLVSAKDFLFGLEPVVEFQARLPASPEEEFVGPSPDLFFEGKRLDRRVRGPRPPPGALDDALLHR